MIKDEETELGIKRKIVAEKILKDGWIEANPENIKAYMDGFIMKTKRSFDETNITAEEYIKEIEEQGYSIQTNNEHLINPQEIAENAIGMGITSEEEENGGLVINEIKEKEISQHDEPDNDI